MNCCPNCFRDKEIIGFIFSNSNNIGICDYCKSNGIALIDTRELAEYFQPVVALFKPISTLGIVVKEPKLLHEKLQENWNIFNLPIPTIKTIVFNIVSDDISAEDPLLVEPVEIELLFKASQPGDIHEKKWENFAEEIKHKNRFFLDETIDLSLLSDLFKNFARTYQKGKIFYRGRISDASGFTVGEMGKPPADLSMPGRANPKGIPYLYISTKVETTVYESRSSYLDYISIAEFKTLAEIKVVSLRAIADISPFVFGDQFANYLTHQKYLTRLEKELSRPIRRFDKELDYLPSQYLCEYVKSLGYDAIEYGSSFKTDGINLAIFDDSKLEAKKVQVYEITEVDLSYNKCQCNI